LLAALKVFRLHNTLVIFFTIIKINATDNNNNNNNNNTNHDNNNHDNKTKKLTNKRLHDILVNNNCKSPELA